MATSRTKNRWTISFGTRVTSLSPFVHTRTCNIDKPLWREEKLTTITDTVAARAPAVQVLTINYNFDVRNFPSQPEIRDKVSRSGLFFANRCAIESIPALRLITIPRCAELSLSLPRESVSRRESHRFGYKRTGKLEVLLWGEGIKEDSKAARKRKGGGRREREHARVWVSIAIGLTRVCLICYAPRLTDSNRSIERYIDSSAKSRRAGNDRYDRD